MLSVMISGHFNGLHSGHLDYMEQAKKLGSVICIVSSDRQLDIKRREHLPEDERLKLAETLLRGLGCDFLVFLNAWDRDISVAEALSRWNPDIFLRGYDKTPEDMPKGERMVCEANGIQVKYAENRIGERHSSEVFS
jgi:D-beta-D-heptose 7-phosphate kinase/D-beta-D-heptose 1-phosphate adenosyltransferase